MFGLRENGVTSNIYALYSSKCTNRKLAALMTLPEEKRPVLDIGRIPVELVMLELEEEEEAIEVGCGHCR